MSTPQTGDVLIVSDPSGGAEFTIAVINGTTSMTQDFTSEIILSLFGGNERDDGRPDNDEGYWGNLLENEDQFKLVSLTQNILRGLAATSANLLLVDEAVRADLAHFLNRGTASSVDVLVQLVDVDRVRISVTVRAEGLEQDFSFVENWKAGVN